MGPAEVVVSCGEVNVCTHIIELKGIFTVSGSFSSTVYT